LKFVHGPTVPVLGSADHHWIRWLAGRPVPARRIGANIHADQDAEAAILAKFHAPAGSNLYPDAPTQRHVHPDGDCSSPDRFPYSGAIANCHPAAVTHRYPTASSNRYKCPTLADGCDAPNPTTSEAAPHGYNVGYGPTAPSTSARG
jgi:hypothetical protein